MKIDKTPYRITCIILANPSYSSDGSCWFPCKIINCNDETKEYPKSRIVCKILPAEKAQLAKSYKKAEKITMIARINKTIRITEDIKEGII